jgi:hypothetical protein
MTQKTNPWTFDVRVRERNLKAGTVTEKDVEKYIGGLPDLADQSEAFGTSQPALAQPIVEKALETSSHESDADAELDEDEDEDEDEDTIEPSNTPE